MYSWVFCVRTNHDQNSFNNSRNVPVYLFCLQTCFGFGLPLWSRVRDGSSRRSCNVKLLCSTGWSRACLYHSFLSCQSVCFGHNWFHGPSRSILTQDDEGGTRHKDSFVLLLYILPIKNLFGIQAIKNLRRCRKTKKNFINILSWQHFSGKLDIINLNFMSENAFWWHFLWSLSV